MRLLGILSHVGSTHFLPYILSRRPLFEARAFCSLLFYSVRSNANSTASVISLFDVEFGKFCYSYASNIYVYPQHKHQNGKRNRGNSGERKCNPQMKRNVLVTVTATLRFITYDCDNCSRSGILGSDSIRVSGIHVGRKGRGWGRVWAICGGVPIGVSQNGARKVKQSEDL